MLTPFMSELGHSELLIGEIAQPASPARINVRLTTGEIMVPNNIGDFDGLVGKKMQS